MTVMAHPDDAELWAGGTLAHHTRAGTEVTITVPRSGEIRDKEAAAGADILGASLRRIDELTVPALRQLLGQICPQVVITHPPHDIHPDHQKVAGTLLAALPEAVIATGCPQRVYTCDGYNNLDRDGRPLDLPVLIDVTATWETKLAALAAHASQPIDGHFGPMAETLGRLHGRRIARRYAEA
ncbi:MAG: PIG-L deacetylase family protein, partial [Micromonosporaceae bacterium]